MYFCISEKLVCFSAFVTILEVIRQLYIYIWSHKIPLNDRRITILAVCLLSSINVFVHYGFFTTYPKAKTFFLIELFRFVVFFMICYYYIVKSSGLLSNRKWVILLLKAIFVFSTILYVTLGVDGYINV